MTRFRKVLTVAAAFVLTLTAAVPPATAAELSVQRPMQVNEARAAVGATWRQLLPSGQVVTMQKLSTVESKTLEPVTAALSSCPNSPYLCAWSNQVIGLGTEWLYNMNNVRSNTVNGVAHCWNMASDANNHTLSWVDLSTSWPARMHNWVNCNESDQNFDLASAKDSLHNHISCWEFDGGVWCHTYFVTSIEALDS